MRNISISALLFFVTVLVIVLVFMNLNENQGNLSMSMTKINWLQIPIFLAIGFLLGIVFTKKKRKKIWF